MILNERQRTAESLAHELHKLGAWVCSPMPLNDFNPLRYQVLDEHRQAVTQRLSEWGWSPTWCGSMPRVTPRGFEQASLFKIEIPLPRMAVPDDRIPGDIDERKKTSAEL